MSDVILLSSEDETENLDNKELLEIKKELSSISQLMAELEVQKMALLRKKELILKNMDQKKTDKLSKENWDRTDHPWSNNLTEKLQNTFCVSELRPYQSSAMNATMSGTHCILIMPTGGGKSLCYQLPSLLSKGITLVVSPLISLMEDQLMHLHRLGIPAKMFCSSTTKEEGNLIFTAMTDTKSPIKLLYVTPEKLAKSKRFMSKLQKMYQLGLFARLAIDEVHCCSQWGHDFRPDYKFLGAMTRMFPKTPVLGLTATATSKVIGDVQKILNLQGSLVLKSSFNRPNLFYEVRQKPSNQKECISQLSDLLKTEFKNQSGIIYTMTVKETEELAKELRASEIRVAPYHAYLDAEVRSKIHRKWVDGQYQAVVATIAFGMGIDKPDVRFVIHHCISKSMENFYQESGRAGRDNKKARCILFWRLADLSRQSTMVFTEQTGLDNLYAMILYCIDVHRCRRKMIAEHFDEEWKAEDCKEMCDNCAEKKSYRSLDLSNYAAQLLTILKHCQNIQQKVTAPKLLDAWLGKGATNLRVKGAEQKGLDRINAETIFASLLIDGFLKEDFQFTPYSTISYITEGYKAQASIDPSPLNIVINTKRKQSNDEDIRKKLKNHSL